MMVAWRSSSVLVIERDWRMRKLIRANLEALDWRCGKLSAGRMGWNCSASVGPI